MNYNIYLAIVSLVCTGVAILILNENSKLTKAMEILKQKSITAVATSKAVTRGKIAEEFIPLFPEFPYCMSDCKFSGAPIDYIVFDGMSRLRDEGQGEIEIIFADVKTNAAVKTKIQRAIEDAIKNGRFKWETWRIDENKQLKIK